MFYANVSLEIWRISSAETMGKTTVSSSRTKSDCWTLKCQLKVYVVLRPTHDVKSSIFACPSSVRHDDDGDESQSHKTRKIQFPAMTDASVHWSTFWCETFSRCRPTKRRWRQKKWSGARERQRKAGSEAYLHRDDGMYHLKVINLKISRERRREERREMKASICISLSFEFE